MPLNMLLASSLLDLELAKDHAAAQVGGRMFTTGIASLDKDLPSDLFSDGDVIGISSINSDCKSLSLEIIATHIVGAAQRTATSEDSRNNVLQTSVFIVAPPDQATASIRQVYQILNSRISQARSEPLASSRTTLSKPQSPLLDAKSLLNSVSLLQYLDIAGLAESLSEVFSAITSEAAGSYQKIILLVQGLTSCITTTQRRSVTLQTAALLSSVLQNIRSIARSGGGSALCLGLIELDIVWSNPLSTSGGVGGQYSSSAISSGTQNNNNNDNAMAGVLDTAFAARAGRLLRLNMNNNSILSTVLEQNLDVLVAIHDADGKVDALKEKKLIVEVVQDERAGHAGEESALGEWAVWS